MTQAPAPQTPTTASTPANPADRSRLSRKWTLKIGIIAVLLVGYGVWGLYDATVSYPQRGSDAAEYCGCRGACIASGMGIEVIGQVGLQCASPLFPPSRGSDSANLARWSPLRARSAQRPRRLAAAAILDS